MNEQTFTEELREARTETGITINTLARIITEVLDDEEFKLLIEQIKIYASTKK